MHDLTARQVEILKSLIEEYIEIAEPVGSETLEKKHNLSASPATIRNEMVKLTDLGYLKKPHVSAGRIPTPMGMKFYVKQLMKEKELSVTEEVSLKEKVWDFRNEFERLLKETTHELANRTRSLAVCTTDHGAIYSYGASNLLEEPEFYNIDVTKTVLGLLDNPAFWFDIIAKASVVPGDISDTEIIHLLVGEDLGIEHLDSCGFIYQTYEAGPHRGIVGVVGPARTHYQSIVPIVGYFAQLLSTITR